MQAIPNFGKILATSDVKAGHSPLQRLPDKVSFEASFLASVPEGQLVPMIEGNQDANPDVAPQLIEAEPEPEAEVETTRHGEDVLKRPSGIAFETPPATPTPTEFCVDPPPDEGARQTDVDHSPTDADPEKQATNLRPSVDLESPDLPPNARLPMVDSLSSDGRPQPTYSSRAQNVLISNFSSAEPDKENPVPQSPGDNSGAPRIQASDPAPQNTEVIDHSARLLPAFPKPRPDAEVPSTNATNGQIDAPKHHDVPAALADRYRADQSPLLRNVVQKTAPAIQPVSNGSTLPDAPLAPEEPSSTRPAESTPIALQTTHAQTVIRLPKAEVVFAETQMKLEPYATKNVPEKTYVRLDHPHALSPNNTGSSAAVAALDPRADDLKAVAKLQPIEPLTAPSAIDKSTLEQRLSPKKTATTQQEGQGENYARVVRPTLAEPLRSDLAQTVEQPKPPVNLKPDGAPQPPDTTIPALQTVVKTQPLEIAGRQIDPAAPLKATIAKTGDEIRGPVSRQQPLWGPDPDGLLDLQRMIKTSGPNVDVTGASWSQSIPPGVYGPIEIRVHELEAKIPKKPEMALPEIAATIPRGDTLPILTPSLIQTTALGPQISQAGHRVQNVKSGEDAERQPSPSGEILQPAKPDQSAPPITPSAPNVTRTSAIAQSYAHWQQPILLPTHSRELLPTSQGHAEAEWALDAPDPLLNSAPTPQSIPLPGTPRTEVRLVQHVATQLTSQAPQTAQGAIEISLQPEELGRVRMLLALTETGVTINLAAERPETMDLMRRHIDVLNQEFKNLGYRDINFNFSGENSNEDGGAAEHGSTRQNGTEAPELRAEINPPISDGASDTIDIRI